VGGGGGGGVGGGSGGGEGVYYLGEVREKKNGTLVIKKKKPTGQKTKTKNHVQLYQKKKQGRGGGRGREERYSSRPGARKNIGSIDGGDLGVGEEKIHHRWGPSSSKGEKWRGGCIREASKKGG